LDIFPIGGSQNRLLAQRRLAEKWAVAASNLLGFEAHAALVCRLEFDIGSGT
jgi:hypothetical protein